MVTWNARKQTKRSLDSIRETRHPKWRVVVVDNGSTDGSTEWLASLGWVTLIKNSSNLGFTHAFNQGIAAADQDADLVLLNNDIVQLDPNWLTDLQDAAYTADDIGIVGARLVDGEGRVDHAGSYVPPVSLHGQKIGGRELDIRQATRNRLVESVVFAEVYLRRSCVDEVGVLDEEFFAYFEDTDYCLRAQLAGWKVLYAGQVEAVHREHTSTRENNVDLRPIFEDSKKIFARKWAEWLEDGKYEVHVTWRSVVRDSLGYGAQSRKLMQSMHHERFKVYYQNAYGRRDGPLGHPLLDDLMRRKSTKGIPRISFCQADAFRRVPDGLQIGWSMLEVTGLPDDWVDGCNSMDEVWVPASFNVETFRSSGVNVPIQVMPLGVDLDYFHPDISSFRTTDRFTFLSVFEWGERKAPEVLLRAFADEFGKSDDVLLLLAVANNDPQVDVWAQVGKMNLPEDVPVVVMLNWRLPDYQMGALYRSADCFVLPSRGEGWGMPVIEAMACGLPTIATSWSGPADFLHEKIGYPLHSGPLVLAEARCPYYEGFRWANPDYEHLRFLMREVYEQPEAARERGAKAAAEVAYKYGLESITARIRKRLLELGQTV